MKLTKLEALVAAMRAELEAKGQEDADVSFYITRNEARVFLDTSSHFLDLDVQEFPPDNLREHRIAYPGMSAATPIRGWSILVHRVKE